MTLGILASVIFFQNGMLLSKWFPQLSGRNALEDYVNAADLISTGEFAAYSTWKSPDGIPSTLQEVPVRISRAQPLRQDQLETFAAALRAKLKQGDFAEVCTLEADEYASALSAIRTGNSKAMQISGSATDIGRFSVDLGSPFQALANLSLRAAYSKFLAGKSDQAVTFLIDQLVFSDRVARLSVTASASEDGIVTAIARVFAARLGQLSLADCLDVKRSVARLLAQPPVDQGLMEYLRRFWRERITDDVDRLSRISVGDSGTPLPGEIDDAAVASALRKMTTGQRQALVQSSVKMAETAMDQYEVRFNGPEIGWLAGPPPNQLFKPGGVSSSDDIALQLAYRSRPRVVSARLVSGAVSRTRLRLLELHAAILAFGWKRGRLPVTLDEVDAHLVHDPLTGQQFQYKLLTGGGYELYSLGNGQTGVIRLDSAVLRPGRTSDLP